MSGRFGFRRHRSTTSPQYQYPVTTQPWRPHLQPIPQWRSHHQSTLKHDSEPAPPRRDHYQPCNRCGWLHRNHPCPALYDESQKYHLSGYFTRMYHNNHLCNKNCKKAQKIKSPSRQRRDKQRMTEYNRAKAIENQLPFNSEDILMENTHGKTNKLQIATQIISSLKKDLQKLQMENSQLRKQHSPIIQSEQRQCNLDLQNLQNENIVLQNSSCVQNKGETSSGNSEDDLNHTTNLFHDSNFHQDCSHNILSTDSENDDPPPLERYQGLHFQDNKNPHLGKIASHTNKMTVPTQASQPHSYNFRSLSTLTNIPSRVLSSLGVISNQTLSEVYHI